MISGDLSLPHCTDERQKALALPWASLGSFSEQCWTLAPMTVIQTTVAVGAARGGGTWSTSGTTEKALWQQQQHHANPPTAKIPCPAVAAAADSTSLRLSKMALLHRRRLAEATHEAARHSIDGTMEAFWLETMTVSSTI